ncbi:cytochrome P450 71A26-like isoform X2 [Vigna radiata var. radiata]|uniref:Cytochrome P450 71A26-like isoform X2 n=1 Tax=Vigna radiata var. radiata TaxID=3916 RepID=A0A3Q0F3M0_VIGRR|nr:cytochrome P450 71A26-like isoform X2 [Vigna radiata var. radiata]
MNNPNTDSFSLLGVFHSPHFSELLRDFATRELNAFLWLSLVVVTTLLLRRLFSLFGIWRRARTIPGPPSSSFFGGCKLFSRPNFTFTDVLSECHKNYGPIVKLWLGPTQLLVSVRDPILIQDMLIKAEDKLPYTGKLFHLAFGQSSLFAPSFEKVQKRRELLATELNERLLKNGDMIPVKVADFITDKIENIKKKGGIDSRKGCKLSSHTKHDVHNESSNKEMKSADGAKCCSDDEFQDYYFFRDLKDHRDGKEESCGNVMRMIFHGCQTTSVLITDVLTRLVMHGEIQDKVYSEIRMVGRNPSKCEHEDVYRMPLLLATIYESARLLPTGSMLQRCSLKHDLSFASGVTIPAGAVLVVPVELVQKDEFNWGSDASHFNPYRFLSTVTNRSGSAEDLSSTGFSSFVLNDPNENAAFLPFGSGARACIGQKFIIQLVASVLASLLNKYEIRLSSDSNDDSNTTLKNNLLQRHPSSQILFMKRDQ